MSVLLKMYDGHLCRPDAPDGEPDYLLSFAESATGPEIARKLFSDYFPAGDYPAVELAVEEAFTHRDVGVAVRGVEGSWIIRIGRV